ncbi:hypothetical protein FRC04_004834 [Tulasnella sp. 424]|nr:hypothetical protein FRC04_004834 [Tulasnella sp. 424]
MASQKENAAFGNMTNIVITSLSYTRVYHAQHNHALELKGTTFDFELLLRHFDYCHKGNSVNFTLLNDFDVDFTDSSGVQKVIPKADTSRDSIFSPNKLLGCPIQF